ncbi:MAG: ComEC/Rec2 family competence protein [Dyadobacter fermentans]
MKYTTIAKICLAALCLGLTVPGANAQEAGKPLAAWQEGFLDIHHINTGMGNATFLILPDGTTLLVDAGALDPTEARTQSPRNTKAMPDASRQPGEWIARYIRKVAPAPVVDYALITHFHDDHMGTPTSVSKKSEQGKYALAGITEVAEFVPVKKVIDRGWPQYDYPRATRDSMVQNYLAFLAWQIKNKGLRVEASVPGRNDQIVLLRNAAKYKELFEVRNISANGEIWTGVGNVTRKHFPELKDLRPDQYPTENMCSIATRISYGKFDYFTGGDTPGVLQPGVPLWHDVETPVAKAVGPVDAHILDHHGNRDSQNDFLLAALRPRVLVVPVWSSDHPGHDVLDRIYSQRIYPGERDVFATSMLESNKLVIGEMLNRLKSDQGHVVIRVANGGASYQVFVLDDRDEQMKVKSVHGPYESR